MKMNYEAPEIEVNFFQSEDILADSTVEQGSNGNGGGIEQKPDPFMLES